MSTKTIKPKLYGGSFEDLSPELQDILSKRCPCDTVSWLVEEIRVTTGAPGLGMTYKAIALDKASNTSEKRIDEK